MAHQPKSTTELDKLIPQEKDDNNNNASNIQKKSAGQAILELAIPAAGALLIDPLLTLADTAFVGRFSDTPDPLAGMGSAAALITFSFYLFNFLCTATTPLVASKRAGGTEDEAIKVGGQALSLALFLGANLSVLLLVFGQPLLRLMGTSITGEAANGYAMSFLSARAFAAPAVFTIEASTGVLRGYLDTKTPIVILVVSNIINLVLDVILIAYAGLGPLGAGIATTTAEWISAGIFVSVLAGRLPSASGKLGNGREGISIVPIMKLPQWEEVEPLIVASSSIFLRTVVLQLSLAAAAAMVARGGPYMDEGASAAVAAHQIGIQLWLLCSFFCDSLAAASQGLVADCLGRQDQQGAREVSNTVFLYSFVLGISLAVLLQIGDTTHWLFDLFTENKLTQEALSRILPLVIFAQPFNALVFAADGVLQGASEFPFQARAMVVSGISGVATFVALEAGGGTVDTLVHVWSALIALQAMRGITSLYKLADKEGPIDLFHSTS